MLTSVDKSDEYTISVWNMCKLTCMIMEIFLYKGRHQNSIDVVSNLSLKSVTSSY